MKITEKQTVSEIKEVTLGFKCDRCGDVILENESSRTDDFHVKYTAGYGTNNDCKTVEADLCDICVFEIFQKEVPGAKISSW